jgi:hypothetical protein
VLSARLSLKLSECKVCLPCKVILVVQSWGLNGSPAIVFDPPAWCEVARTLCVGDVETPFLGGELLSGGGIKVTKGAWRVPSW